MAGVGAMGAWFLTGPLARGLSRLAFQRKLSDGGATAARFLGAGLAAVFIYLAFPHFGGGGRGTGGGTGDDTGPGIAGKSGTGKPGSDRSGSGKGDKPATTGGQGELLKDGLPVQIL